MVRCKVYFLNSGALGSPGSASTTADPCGTFACLECAILSEVKHRLERS